VDFKTPLGPGFANRLGEFVQRCDEELRELAIPGQTLGGACQ